MSEIEINKRKIEELEEKIKKLEEKIEKLKIYLETSPKEYPESVITQQQKSEYEKTKRDELACLQNELERKENLLLKKLDKLPDTVTTTNYSRDVTEEIFSKLLQEEKVILLKSQNNKTTVLSKNVTQEILEKLDEIVRKTVFPNGITPEFKLNSAVIKEMLETKCFDIFKIQETPLKLSLSERDVNIIKSYDQPKRREIANLFDFNMDGALSNFDFMNEFVYVASQKYPQSDSQTEAYLTSLLDLVIFKPISYYTSRNDENYFTVSKDQQQKTQNPMSQMSNKQAGRFMDIYKTRYSFSTLRSDISVKDAFSRIALKVEIKLSLKMEDALTQLLKSCFPLTLDLYRSIKQIFGITASGSHVELYLLDFDKPSDQHYCSAELITTYDMKYLADRWRLYLSMFFIIDISYRMFYLNQPKDRYILDPVVRKVGQTIVGRIEFDRCTGTIYKRISNVEQDRIELLDEFYSKLKEHHKKWMDRALHENEENYLIFCSDFSYDDKQVHILTAPICTTYEGQIGLHGWNVKLKTVDEFKKFFRQVIKAALSIHEMGYIHNDIRLFNVVHDSLREKSPSNDYILIDYEEAEEIDCGCENNNHTVQKDKPIQESTCPLKDIYDIQQLITKLYAKKTRKRNKIENEMDKFFEELDERFNSITGIPAITGRTLKGPSNDHYDDKLKSLLDYLN